MVKQTARPKYLNLLRIKMPVGAVASIAHRASGVLLFLSLPVTIWLLDRSLQGEPSYKAVIEMLTCPLATLPGVVLVWALAHHLFAGIRFLLLDLRVGLNKSVARTSAWVANISALLVAVISLVAWL